MGNNRGLVNRTAISNSLRNDIAEKFGELHEKTRVPKSKLLDEAVELLLKKYKGKEGQEK